LVYGAPPEGYELNAMQQFSKLGCARKGKCGVKAAISSFFDKWQAMRLELIF